MTISFTVYGTPIPKGSTRAFLCGGKINTVNANAKTKAWQHAVSITARGHAPAELLTGAVTVEIGFYLPRPKTVKRKLPTVPPDLDKLIRCILDALTGIIFKDDAQVTGIMAIKGYAENGMERAEIEIWEGR